MDPQKTVLCIGSVLWDIIGRSESFMAHGADRPGRITRIPGGVALNIAKTLVQFGMEPQVLSAIGQDMPGVELMQRCREMGVGVDYLHQMEDRPTDRYMAVEGSNGLIAAIADAHSLEAAGAQILSPLEDGRLGTRETPYHGPIALDGNLTADLLQEVAQSPLFAQADLRVAPASPGKAERLRPFLSGARATLYVNLEEAGLLCQRVFSDSDTAVQALLDQGAYRALVTDGGNAASDGQRDGIVSRIPPRVPVARVTGAGDTFMAAHIAYEYAGLDRDEALARALMAAAAYVSGDDPL